MRTITLLLVSAAGLYGQAAVEAGLGAARAVTSTAPAAGLGKSIAGALGGLDKTLKSSGTASPSSSNATPAEKSATQTVVVRSSSVAPPVRDPAKTYEDIRSAEVGITYQELLDRFGPSALEVAGEGGVKRLSYPGKDGSTQVEVKDGKVTQVRVPQVQQSVMLLGK